MLCIRSALLRTAWPRLVRQRSVATRKAPGMRIVHQEPVSRAFSESESMLPQVTTSTGRPMPIKLSVDSASMALRTFITTIKRMEGRKLGARCLRST